MMMRQGLACLVVLVLSVTVHSDTICSSSCKDYSFCKSLNATQKGGFLKDSLVCSAADDTLLGATFSNISSCSLKNASIEIADLLDIGWDGVGSIEGLLEDPSFFKEGCEFDHFAAAACVYFSLPQDDAAANCTNATVTRSKMFCVGECMTLASSCLHLEKYRNLKASVSDFCAGVSTTDPKSKTCYNGQIDQTGAGYPDCSVKPLKATSLTGVYILAAIALALSVVALLGLAFLTCKQGNNGGAPNSF